MSDQDWPVLDDSRWNATREGLHLRLQVVGKYRLARTPWINHSWHATFLVSPRGWTTTTVPDGSGIEFEFDVLEEALVGRAGNGRTGSIALRAQSIAAFHAEFLDLVARLGGDNRFHGTPNEVENPVPFAEDTTERPFDGEATRRFHRATASAARAFATFRTGFLGKVSPVHLFWGAFDLAVTRFSGRPAPLHAGGVPGLPDDVAREAYDREVSSAGFWPGGGAVEGAAFYAYAYPAPEGFATAAVRPAAAYWHEALGEFVLPYEAVRRADDPQAALFAFLQSTYEAAADLGGWDRSSLECAVGRPGRVRPVKASPSEAPVDPDHAEPAIARQEGETKGRYHVRVDGTEAEMTYSRLGTGGIIIDHTGVPDVLRGRGVGARLVARAVADARTEGRSILPLCPFAKAQFARHPEWADVLRR